MAQLINEKDFEELVLKSDKPVMLDLFATWCGPCQMLSPVVDELAQELGEKAKVFKADVDENEGLRERFSVEVVPTLLFFKNGELKDRAEGMLDKKLLAEKLEALI